MTGSEAPGSADPSFLSRTVGAWNRFWFAEASPAGLAVFRVLFGYCLWREIATTRALSRHAIEWDGFTLPYASLIPHMSAATYELVHQLQYPLALLIGLGLWPRIACGALLTLQAWVFFADQLNFRNHPYFFMLVLLLMIPSPAGEALSLQSAWRAWRRRKSLAAWLVGPLRPVTFQRLMQFQVCLVYVYAAIHKLHALYLDGGVLQRLMRSDLLEGDSREWLLTFLDETTVRGFLDRPEPFALMGPAVVAVEFALAGMLWFRKTRPAAIVIGTGFHLSIAFIMDIHVFSYAMIATYLLFLDPDTIPRLLRGLTRAVPSVS